MARQTPARKGRPTYAALALVFATSMLAPVSAQPNQTGLATGRVSGRIVVDDTAQAPVRGAIVTVSGNLPRGRSVITDDAGMFEVGNLPPGRYTLAASKAPYVTMAYGARRPDRPGTPVTIGAGEMVRDVVIRLPRGAVVTGTLRDSSGEILPDITVLAVRTDQLGGQAPGRPASALTSVTDDRGVYRIFGIPPGKYLIAASFRVTGLGDTTLLSTADVDRLFAELKRPAVTAAVAPSAALAAQALPVVGFAPTFYPGTIDAADAGIVQLASGEQRTADFVVGPAPTGSIEGVIRMFDGSPLPPVTPDLMTVGPALPPTFGMGPTLSQRPGPDGRFKFSGVLAGRYTVFVRAQPGRGGGPAMPLWGIADVTFAGTDISGVSVTLQPGARMTGRVVFEGTGSVVAPDPSTVTVNLASVGPQGFSSGFGIPSGAMRGAGATVKADGTFEITGIGPGMYSVSAAARAPWILHAAVLNGRDALDGTIEFDPGTDTAGAVLTFSDRRTELSGRLQTAGNTPAVAYFIVVFPADAGLWRPGSRRTQFVRPATDGQFSFSGLPAGAYLVAALTDVEPGDLGDPAFLSQLVPAAVKVTLADGERRTQDLRIAGK